MYLRVHCGSPCGAFSYLQENVYFVEALLKKWPKIIDFSGEIIF